MKSPNDSEHSYSYVYKIYLRHWKTTNVMSQSLPHTFRESVWDVDMCIVISFLKLSGKYMCTCCDIQELRSLPGSVRTHVFHMILTIRHQPHYFLKNINRLVSIKFADYAVYEVRTEILYTIRRTSVFKDSSVMSVLHYNVNGLHGLYVYIYQSIAIKQRKKNYIFVLLIIDEFSPKSNRLINRDSQRQEHLRCLCTTTAILLFGQATVTSPPLFIGFCQADL